MIGGLILAAGAGTRFGGESKLLAPLDGRPLVEYAIRAQCDVDDSSGSWSCLARTLQSCAIRSTSGGRSPSCARTGTRARLLPCDAVSGRSRDIHELHDASQCQIVYFAGSADRELESVVAALDRHATLTVSDGEAGDAAAMIAMMI